MVARGFPKQTRQSSEMISVPGWISMFRRSDDSGGLDGKRGLPYDNCDSRKECQFRLFAAMNVNNNRRERQQGCITFESISIM